MGGSACPPPSRHTNIENDETCQLAGELARLTGETMTGAITIAWNPDLNDGVRLNIRPFLADDIQR